MTITEAIKKARKGPYNQYMAADPAWVIRRKSWKGPGSFISFICFKKGDGAVCDSRTTFWEPTTYDLTAKDWEIVV